MYIYNLSRACGCSNPPAPSRAAVAQDASISLVIPWVRSRLSHHQGVQWSQVHEGILHSGRRVQRAHVQYSKNGIYVWKRLERSVGHIIVYIGIQICNVPGLDVLLCLYTYEIR